MKKLGLSIGFILYSCVLFAQTTTDSSTLTTNKPPVSTLKITYGDSMRKKDNIVTNIARSKELSTFYKAIQIAGLEETFRSKGPITVFAPLNQAFDKLPPSKLDTLLKPEHKYDLIALITYHAIAGHVSTRDIVHEINSHKGLATFITLTGSLLKAKMDGNRNIILIDENGGESIIARFDIEQSNGLIHIINSVLMPKFKNI